jgi:serine/threonine protein kinase
MSMLAAQLELLWKSSTTPPDLNLWLAGLNLAPGLSGESLQDFWAALKVDQRHRWWTDQPWSAEDYHRRLPEFLQNSDCLLELAAGEFEAQVFAGRQICVDDFCGRFPEQAAALRARVRDLEALLESVDIAGSIVRVTQELINGRYRRDRLLGSGKYGKVFLAHDVELQRDVAIKVPTDARLQDSATAEEYLTEARTLAGLNHPHILDVFDVGRFSNGHIYVVSRYVRGGTLRELLRQQRPSPAEAAEILIPVAQALASAHAHRIIHRDVKPDNILIEEHSKRIFLADFGLAINAENRGRQAEIVGTPTYMSPEQVRGDTSQLDGRSDLFSVGVIFYEMLTGQRPFKADNVDLLFEEITSATPAPPRSINRSIPPALEKICLKALAKRPEDRFQTAAAFAKELVEALQPHVTSAATAETPDTAGHEAADTVITRGMCPGCGVIHESLRKKKLPGEVRYCDSPGCRTPLFDSCLACGGEIWIWDQHCLRCNRCSSAQEAAEKHLSTLQTPLQTAFAERRFTSVLKGLEDLKKRPDFRHRRLARSRAWCLELENQLETELSSLAEQAEQRLLETDFHAAAELLSQIPETRRSTAKYNAAIAKRKAVSNLENQFREALADNQLQQASDYLGRLHEYQPKRTDLHETFRQHIAALHNQASERVQQHDYEAALALLDAIPEEFRNEAEFRLWTQRYEEIVAVKSQIRIAIAACNIKSLHAGLTRLEELCPGDPAADADRTELTRLVDMRHRQAEGLADLKQDYEAALACLAGIPESLIRKEIRNRILDRHDRIQQLEEELQQNLARGDLAAAWSCSTQLSTLIATPSAAQHQLLAEAARQNADAAAIARQKKNWNLALQYLEHIPAPLRDQELHLEVTAATERISELRNKLSTALAKKQLRRAAASAAELNSLQPQIAVPEDELRKLAEKYLRHAAGLIQQKLDFQNAEQFLKDIPERFRDERWKSLINRRQELENLTQSLAQLLAQKQLNELHHGLLRLEKLQPRHPQLEPLHSALQELVKRIEADCEDRIRRFLDYEIAATELEQIPYPLRNPTLHAQVSAKAAEILECRERIRTCSFERNWVALQKTCHRLLKILPDDYAARLHLKLATDELSRLG